jgi:hypothetical protein
MRKSALLIEILTLLRINLRVWFYPILPNLPIFTNLNSKLKTQNSSSPLPKPPISPILPNSNSTLKTQNSSPHPHFPPKKPGQPLDLQKFIL